MGTLYDEGVLRWAGEQAALLREGKHPMPGLGHPDKSGRRTSSPTVSEPRYCSLRNGSAGSGLQRT